LVQPPNLSSSPLSPVNRKRLVKLDRRELRELERLLETDCRRLISTMELDGDPDGVELVVNDENALGQ
jgi:hypothetical protein